VQLKITLFITGGNQLEVMDTKLRQRYRNLLNDYEMTSGKRYNDSTSSDMAMK